MFEFTFMMIFESLVLLTFLVSVISDNGYPTHSFTLDKQNNQFLKDGKPYRYISASMHYFRVPSEYWEDRLKKLKYMGLDAVQTYVAWNFHETYDEQYDFTGDRDIFHFFKLAQKHGLDVIIRPGPYIDAEWDLGGLPYWLLKNKTLVSQNTLRTFDDGYFKYVKRWFEYLLPRLVPYLYKSGGPIITVQVENEYGSYFACDRDYLGALVILLRKHLGHDVVLFTTDGNDMGFMRCGKIPDVYATVDFGTGANVTRSFAVQRQVEPDGGPFVNSEFYVGWIDHWGYPHSRVSTDQVTNALTQILDTSNTTCVNLYLGHGGTSFGFWNGAETAHAAKLRKSSSGMTTSLQPSPFSERARVIGNNLKMSYHVTLKDQVTYFPNPTSYDFDAPISESGDMTYKYHAIRDTIGKYKSLPRGEPPRNMTMKAYGQLTLYRVDNFFSMFENSLEEFIPRKHVLKFQWPPTFEQLDHPYGFVFYTHVWNTKDNEKFGVSSKDIGDDPPDPPENKNYTLILETRGLRDRGYLYLDQYLVGIPSRMTGEYKFNFVVNTWPMPEGTVIKILVENQGRVCYGSEMNDTKGILDGIYLNGTYIDEWDVYPINFTHINDAITSRILDELKDPVGYKERQLKRLNANTTLKQLEHKKHIWFDQKQQLNLNGKEVNTRNNFRVLSKSPLDICYPAFFAGHFELPVKDYGRYPNDTFLDLKGWSKGNAYLNGRNLGRYWTPMGPQQTLYVPGPFFKTNGIINTLSVFEMESQPPCNFPGQTIDFVDKAIFIKNIKQSEALPSNTLSATATINTEKKRQSSNEVQENEDITNKDTPQKGESQEVDTSTGKLSSIFTTNFWSWILNFSSRNVVNFFFPYLPF